MPSPSFSTTAAYAAEGAPNEAHPQEAKRPYLDFDLLNASERFFRAKVKGGWLVMVQGATGIGQPGGTSITFYPDPNHEWDGGSVK